MQYLVQLVTQTSRPDQGQRTGEGSHTHVCDFRQSILKHAHLGAQSACNVGLPYIVEDRTLQNLTIFKHRSVQTALFGGFWSPWCIFKQRLMGVTDKTRKLHSLELLELLLLLGCLRGCLMGLTFVGL